MWCALTLVQLVASPFEQAIDGWILGSESFADRVRELLQPEDRRPSAKKGRRKARITQEQIVQTVCDVLEVDPVVLSTRGSRHPARALVAYLSRYATDSTLTQIAEQLGLSRADCVPNQIRRITRSPLTSELRRQLDLVEAALGLTQTSLTST